MTTLDLLTRLAEVQADPPGTPEHSAPEWLVDLCVANLVSMDGGFEHDGESWIQVRPLAYRITKAGELVLEVWSLPPPTEV